MSQNNNKNINPLEKIDLKTKPLLIIFDSHNLIYRSYFAVPKLHDRNNRPTNAIQGTCSILLKFFQNYPDALYCMASDSKGGNFRHQLYNEYKANRKETDDDLLQQIIVMPKFYEAFGMRVMAAQGYEADDFIATIVRKFKDDHTILIASSDKDLMQLICDGIIMIDPTKDTFFDEQAVIEKFGVNPCQIKDYLSLIGDASDNIPGAKSVGPKTAIKILNYGSLSDIIQNPDLIADKKLRQTVIDNIENIILSEKLVKLVDDIDIQIDLKDIKVDWKSKANDLYKIFGEYSMQALQKRIEKFVTMNNQGNNNINIAESHLDKQIIRRITQIGKFSIISNQDGIKIAVENQIYKLTAPLEIKDLLEDNSIKKITYDGVQLEQELKKSEINLNGIYDISILYYHLMGVKANSSILDILYFVGLDEFTNSLDHQKSSYILAFDKLFDEGLEQLFKIKHLNFFEDDRKIYNILRKMENNGILVDKNILKNLGNYFEDLLHKIKDEIIDLTGYDFNILSPKQTSEVLFDKLELKPSKKSKNEGVYSTSQAILEDLSEDGIEAADCILRYRSIYKLKSSYCDSLENDISPETGRIHTSFALNGATTGRILSSSPNLQNIPTKTEEGRKIRSCFIAKENYKLISADYSQIELRILAHIAGVKNLQIAFEKDEDIHKLTASQVFGIPFDNVDDFWRSKAKAVNFGIIYGISAFGLSKQLKISAKEADSIIKNYLACYSEINQYLENTKNFAEKHGFVETIFGRRCHIRPLAKGNGNFNFHEKQAFERMAINAPIQGTASDLIKLAMIKIDDFITDNNLQTKILLQIHDELIFETPDNEINFFKDNLEKIMENIGKKVDIKLKVGIGIGENWKDL